MPIESVLNRQPTDAWSSRLQSLLQSTGEGIYGIDTEGCCTFINRAAAEMLGLAREAVLGRNMHQLMHHTHADGRHYGEAHRPIFKASRGGQSCRVDSEVMWRADGSSFEAEYSSYPILDGGIVQGAAVDISARKRAEALLLQSHEQLELRVIERTAELSLALVQMRELPAQLESVREDAIDAARSPAPA